MELTKQEARVRGGALCTDRHAGIEHVRVHRIVRPEGLEDLRRVVLQAAREERAISIAGGRHAMGAQAFGTDTIHVDTGALNRVLDFDAARGLFDVEAGILWPELVRETHARQGGEPVWGIRQKQTGADRLSLGGALSANIHGRGLTMKPFVEDVESFRLLTARGELVTCSRTENRELFRLAIGGYGLFGLVYSVCLRLERRRMLRREVVLGTVDELVPAFEERIREGCLYGDFQFAIDHESEDFLRAGVFSCYRPIEKGEAGEEGDAEPPVPDTQKALSADDWMGLLRLAHTDKSKGFRCYAAHYLATDGQVYASDTHQLGVYLDDYHKRLDEELGCAVKATEVIGELYVPREELAGFLAEARADLRRREADVIYGTVRLIRRDDETFLPWAKKDYACVVLNLHTEHTPRGIERTARAFRSLIDLALARGGSFYLTYGRFATRAQVEAAYPEFREFLALKRRHDPDGRFQSDWHRHYRGLFEEAHEAHQPR